MLIHTSVVRRNRTQPFFYLGSTEPREFERFIDDHGFRGFALSIGPDPQKYCLLPEWLYKTVQGRGTKLVGFGEFDLTICSSGGGIPTVQRGLDLIVDSIEPEKGEGQSVKV